MRVLIVDADPDLRAVIGIILRREGYEVCEAANGEEGFRCWHEQATDLILVDLNLPRMIGWELCERIRAESLIPIVMLSIAGEGSDLARAQALGVADYIPLPFNPVELVSKIRSVLTRRPD